MTEPTLHPTLMYRTHLHHNWVPGSHSSAAVGHVRAVITQRAAKERTADKAAVYRPGPPPPILSPASVRAASPVE